MSSPGKSLASLPKFSEREPEGALSFRAAADPKVSGTKYASENKLSDAIPTLANAFSLASRPPSDHASTRPLLNKRELFFALKIFD